MTLDDDATDGRDPGGRPPRPDLPAYVLDPLERQPPERLERVAEYARALAAHERATGPSKSHGGDSGDSGDGRDGSDSGAAASTDSGTGSGTRVAPEELESLAESGVSTDPGDYESVPEDGAYVTIKETKPGYRYYYWQWRDGDSWKNRYIGPVPGGE